MSGKGPELARLWLRKADNDLITARQADTLQRYGRNLGVSPNEFRATTNMKNKTMKTAETV